MKKKILVCSLIAICIAAAAFGTTAYFTHEDTATNVITAGDVKIKLQEWSLSPDDNLIPFKGEIDVLPGTDVSKIAEVKNTGGQSAWIRISLQKSIELSEGTDGTPNADLITLDINTDYWTEKDGFYYYRDALKSGETTKPLFTKVYFEKTMDNMYQNSKAIITLTAHGTQSVHNGDTVLDAAGWPAKDN